MRAREEAVRILEAALGLASQANLDAEVSLGGGSLGVTRFADNEVHESIELDRECFAVRVFSRGRVGRAETTDCSSAGIQVALKQARMVTELLPASEESIELPTGQNYQIVDAYDPETDRANALDRMAQVGRTILAANRHGLLTSGYVSTGLGAISVMPGGDSVYAVANTRGLLAYHAGTRATISVTMARKDGATGWAEAESYALGALDMEALAEASAKKALRQGEPRALRSGPYTVVLEPAAVASLLSFVAQTAGAEDMHNGRSFLSDRLGQKIAGDGITISDDHAHALHRGIPFDVEGVAKRKVVIIDGGVAKQPVYSLASARRYSAEPTGHRTAIDRLDEGERASHLVMGGGDNTLAELTHGTKAGILITRLWYVRMVDPRTLALTGLTRDGTFLIEDGEIVAPVRNMRFNVNVLDFLGAIEAMSIPVRSQGLVVPAVRAHDFKLTGAA
jgi:predicted Zn-dependent protease